MDPKQWVKAIFAMESLLYNLCYAIIAMQSLLCNLCYAIFAMQSLVCNLCYAIFAMQSLLWNLCYAIFAMQSLLCNLCYAIFAMQSLLCSKTLWNLCFLQYFAENIEKPLVFLCFCIQSAQKPYKTCVFCNMLLKMLKNHWFSFVFGAQSAKNNEKPYVFWYFFGYFGVGGRSASAIPSRAATLAASRLCVSFCFLLWCSMRTLRSKLLLGKKQVLKRVAISDRTDTPCIMLNP